MKIYVCGKISNLPLEEVEEKFRSSVRKLLEARIPNENIVNPLDIVPDNSSWEQAMEICLRELQHCDAIYIQRDWRNSIGAKKEITFSQKTRKILLWEESNDLDCLINEPPVEKMDT